jgi:hypothetical protein
MMKKIDLGTPPRRARRRKSSRAMLAPSSAAARTTPRARSTTHSVTRSNQLRIATGRKARATTVRATFFDRLKKSTDDDVDAEGEAGDGEDEGEGGEARKMIERRASGASLDIDDAMASFNEFGSGMLDKINAMVSQTVDLDVVEVVEEDVYERPKPKFKAPAFGGRKEPVEAPKEKKERAGRAPSFGFGGRVSRSVDEEKVEEEPKPKSSGFGAILERSARRLDKTREILDEDVKRGEAARMKLRAGREGGKAVAAIAGDSRLAADGTWTLTSVVEEGTNGKKLPSLKIKRGESKIIGRAKGPGVDLVVPLPCVSTVHCELETEGNKLYITDLGSTNGTYVEGFEVKQNRRFRIFNGAQVRLGAENFNGEPYATFKASLSGAKELEKDSEYGQLNYFIEFLGGPQVVVNFLFINFAFQMTFFFIITSQ